MIIKFHVLVLTLALLNTAIVFSQTSMSTKKKSVNPPGSNPPIGPYSPGVMVGNMLFISGQIGIDPKTGAIPGNSFEDETHQVMKNLEAVLKAEGLTFDNVVKCTIYLSKMENFTAVNKVYGSYFKEGQYPARETVEVSKLPRNVNVEISAIAIKY